MFELIIGLIGMALILFAFFMNQTHKWKAEYPIYDIVNIIGAALLITYSLLIKSWPFLILNAVWFIVSVRELFIDIKAKGLEKPEASFGYKRK